MGVRDVIVFLACLLVAYIAYMLFRLVRPSAPVAVDEPAGEAAGRAEPQDGSPNVQGGGETFFRLQFEVQQLRRELEARDESIVALRSGLTTLQGEMAALRQRLESTPTGPVIAPQYGEAMLLAKRGLDADTIAERCGISVGEAELVRSMAQEGGGGL